MLGKPLDPKERDAAMASYHLAVKTVSRSAGRSATAAAAYRSGAAIACEREGVVHDYTRRSGVDHTQIVLPADAPAWAADRAALFGRGGSSVVDLEGAARQVSQP